MLPRMLSARAEPTAFPVTASSWQRWRGSLLTTCHSGSLYFALAANFPKHTRGKRQRQSSIRSQSAAVRSLRWSDRAALCEMAWGPQRAALTVTRGSGSLARVRPQTESRAQTDTGTQRSQQSLTAVKRWDNPVSSDRRARPPWSADTCHSTGVTSHISRSQEDTIVSSHMMSLEQANSEAGGTQVPEAGEWGWWFQEPTASARMVTTLWKWKMAVAFDTVSVSFLSFETGSCYLQPRLALNWDPPASVSWVARVTGPATTQLRV
jgi:hypothetical protein